MSQNKLTSIIMLAYKEPEKFIQSFETLIKNTHSDVTPYEIIIIGNNPDNDIKKYLEVIQQSYSNIFVRIYMFDKNLGTAGGFNRGAEVAKGHYICFFNSDYYMMNHWLESMIDCFEHSYNIGLISCCTNVSGNKDEKCLDQIYLKGDYKESECAIAQMFTTKTIWDSINGFDESFYPCNFEDLDFNERVKAEGYRIFVNRKCFGYHDYEASKQIERAEATKKNRQLFKNKHGDKFKWA
jgi:GT2 family glycosyltransferase